MRIAPAGDRGLLATMRGASAARLRACAEAARRLPGVVAAIVGHESVLVVGTSDGSALQRVLEADHDDTQSATTRHAIDVSFAAEYALDLDLLLSRAQLSRTQLIARISHLTLTARYLGFRGGFAYLEGWPEGWSLSRRPTSRNRVPGGSLGVANVMAGFYPADLPGGWNIIGRTDSLPRLRPGDEVQIVPVDRPLIFESRKMEPPAGDIVADVVASGQLTTLVTARDWKRAEDGESPGGPFDEDAAGAANEAVGNAADAPLLECVLVGPRLRFRSPRRVAWCGPSRQPQVWDGEEIDIGRIRGAFRGYLAIEGGVAAFGKTLCSGGLQPAGAVGLPEGSRYTNDRLTIRIVRGPHEAPPLPEEWEVTPNIDRVGIRMRSLTAVNVTPAADLPSCGMQFGTVQWHPDGSIVVMGPDHPVTGGYLQPATVVSSELWKLGQLAPGERVRLTAV